MCVSPQLARLCLLGNPADWYFLSHSGWWKRYQVKAYFQPFPRVICSELSVYFKLSSHTPLPYPTPSTFKVTAYSRQSGSASAGIAHRLMCVSLWHSLTLPGYTERNPTPMYVLQSTSSTHNTTVDSELWNRFMSCNSHAQRRAKISVTAKRFI